VEGHEPQPRGAWSLLVRRNLTTGELAFYRCYTPAPTTLAQLITVAGRRWTLLAMLAHALLAVITAAEREHSPADAGLIELTCAEVRRLLTVALAPLTAPADALAHTADWSRWRRHHQHRARTCHYARRGVQLP
jgi:hypothetical protein